MVILHVILLATQLQTPNPEQILHASRKALEGPVTYVTVSGNVRTKFYLGSKEPGEPQEIRVERQEGGVQVTIITQSDTKMYEVFEGRKIAIDMEFTQALIKHQRSLTGLGVSALEPTSFTKIELHEIVKEDDRTLFVIDNLFRRSEEDLRKFPDTLLGHRVWVDEQTLLPVKYGYLQPDGSVSGLTSYVEINTAGKISPALFSVPDGFEIVEAATVEEYTKLKMDIYSALTGSSAWVPLDRLTGAEILEEFRESTKETVARNAAASSRLIDLKNDQRSQSPIRSSASTLVTKNSSSNTKMLLILNAVIFGVLGIILLVRKLASN